MADLRVTGGSPSTALQPARTSEAVRSAQRAFFQAALNGVAPSAPARPVEAQPQTTVSRTPTPQTVAAAAAEPTRYMRPGSLLDIKV